ncbi:MAG: hypothetical protein AAFY76_05590, partial [Cyanobacteria bacterium J06649_11]
MADVDKEIADGVVKGSNWKSLKAWILGFDKSKRVKELEVVPDRYKRIFFPASKPKKSPEPLGPALNLGNLFST